MSDKPQNQATAKAAWVTFSTNSYPKLLLYVYSYVLCDGDGKVYLAVVCVEPAFIKSSHICIGCPGDFKNIMLLQPY